MTATALRLGIDLGGTKIAGAVLARDDHVVAEARVAAPQHSYEATLNALATMIGALEQQAGLCSVGIGMPGSLSPRTGLVQNANSIWLNGRALQADLEGLTSRPIRFANDANCFALSEAHDGSALGAHTVFGVILGTGCGGGIVIDGKLVDGPRGIGGEWGHTPLPWPTRAELDVAPCWCGRSGCLETWISGSALAADHRRVSGVALAGEAIVAEAGNGFPPCAGDAGSTCRPSGARACCHRQHPRPRCDCVGRRPLGAATPLSAATGPHDALHLCRSAHGRHPSPTVGRRQRCARCGAAVAITT
jgi:fructokinase